MADVGAIRRISIRVIAAPAFLLVALAAAMFSGDAQGTRVEAQEGGPQPATPIEHFIVLMQENHSFDNYFGTYPGADGIPVGTRMPLDLDNPAAGFFEPFHLGDRSDVSMSDPDHSKDTFEQQFNGGAMNGFVSALKGVNPDERVTMGYYDDRDIPFYWNIADEYVLYDRFFSSAGEGSFINHMYWVAGVPATAPGPFGDGLGDTPTIFDRLDEAGVDWKFYVQNYHPEITYRAPAAGDAGSQLIWVPLLNYARYLDDPELNKRIVNLDQYYKDLRSGDLPAVSYIVPSGASEHPPAHPRAGVRLVKTLITELMRSSSWDTSAFMWTYDDWGGWYDHVAPPQIDEFGYGFRVPTLLVSPYARRGYVDSTELDYTSILKFIGQNWGLAPLAVRDAQAKSFSGGFDFSQAPRPAVFLSDQRGETVKTHPNRAVIYVAYAAAPTIAAIGLALPALAYFFWRRKTPGGPPSGSGSVAVMPDEGAAL